MNSERWQQVEQLFHSALTWEPADRSRLLRQACQEDEELQREVESLLFADQEALSLLDHGVDGTAAADRLEEGSQFDCYRIEGLLGEGGMGGVYRARDVKLDREVAFKVVAQAIAGDPDYLHRFEEEARLASSLNHPNIVTIYAVGEDNGVAYIAMELVRGRTLAELLSESTLAMRRVLDLAIQLAGALATAHASGIIHRDLKPANIMVTAQDRVKVLDFGLAKRNPGVIPTSPPVAVMNAPAFRSSAGVILGTAGYMAPEQALGGQADLTSDQFSFGAILYEMLSGRRAFKRETAAQTLAAIIHEQPSPIQSLNPEVTEPLRQIVERCLAKEPSGRYPDTGELAAALREALSGWEASSAVEESGWTRRRVLVAAGLAAASAVGLATWQLWPRDTGIRVLAVLPFENTAKDPDAATLCEGLTESLIRQIARVSSLKVSPRSAAMILKGKAVDPQAAGRKLGVEAIVSGSVVRRGGQLSVSVDLVDVKTGKRLWSKTYDRDEASLLDVQEEIAKAVVVEGIRLKLSDDDWRRLTRRPTNDREAHEYYMSALHHHDRGTEQDYLDARDLLEKAIARDAKFALAYAMLAANYAAMTMDGYARPAESWPMVRKYAAQALVFERDLPAAHLELASEAFYNQWNWVLAEEEFDKGIGAPTGQITELIGGYANTRWALGRPEDALDLIRRAREGDPISTQWRLQQADLLLRTGQNENAATIYDAIIRDDPDDERAYFGLAEVRSEQKRFDEAIAQLEKGYAAAGIDDGKLLKLLATARGEDGYRRVQKRGAQLELDGLNARAASNQYVSPLDFARAYSRLGSREPAFKYLDRAFADHSPGLVFLKVDRAWDAIRDDARFAKAVRMLGFT